MSDIKPVEPPAPAVRSVTNWGAPLVSTLVLVMFGLVIALSMIAKLPDSPGMTMLMGALVSMGSTVVGYWCGSSAGSARKDDTIAHAQASLANSVPIVPVVPIVMPKNQPPPP